MKTTIKLFLLLSLVGGLLFLSSCKKTENITNVTQVVPLPWILAEIDGIAEDSTWVEVDIYNEPSIAYVMINNDTIPRYSPYNLLVYYKHNYPLVHSTDYKLLVTTTSGQSSASLKYPGFFQVTQPTEEHTVLPKNTPLNITWNESVDREWYGVDFYWYLQSRCGSVYHYKYIDTLIMTTTTGIAFSSTLLWSVPANDTARYAYGEFQVFAASGPRLELGALGNITGSATGFFHSFYFTPWKDVGYPTLATSKETEAKPVLDRTREKIREKLLELRK
jgi:hypothetical protein